MILDLDRQYRESCIEARRERRWRWEFGVACLAMLGGFILYRVVSPGCARALVGAREAFGELCLLAAHAVSEIDAVDAVTLRGLILGTLLIAATVHAAERLLDRGRE
jgi:hypothetical protein